MQGVNYIHSNRWIYWCTWSWAVTHSSVMDSMSAEPFPVRIGFYAKPVTELYQMHKFISSCNNGDFVVTVLKYCAIGSNKLIRVSEVRRLMDTRQQHSQNWFPFDFLTFFYCMQDPQDNECLISTYHPRKSQFSLSSNVIRDMLHAGVLKVAY
jgi:hypothetical protein